MKFNEIPTVIKRLEFDGDISDKRLHSDFKIDWHYQDEEEYKKAELDDYKIETDKYIVFGWCDVSGFMYWNDQKHDCNYFQISVFFKQDSLTNDEVNKLNEDLEDVEDHYSQYQMSEEDFMKKLID